VLHLLAGGLELALADPDLPQGHGCTDARSGQDQDGGQALQQGGAGVVLQLEPGAFQLLDFGGIRYAV
jgi:hypothetical protein